MASTRRSRPAEPGRGRPATKIGTHAARDTPKARASPRSGPVDPVVRALAAALPAWRAATVQGALPLRVAVALSGGRDSMVLLDALAQCAAADASLTLQAVHVHHGLSPNADAWTDFCRVQCAKRGVPLTVHRIELARKSGASLEATARKARLAALAQTDADVIALAHHADDQAETVLLQLLRGAGPNGLAAMPALRRAAQGPALARPLLALPRADIVARAAARGVPWIDDESNADTDVRRNFLRHEIAPRLAQAFPGYPATLARAAAHQAESALLADALAARDGEHSIADDPRLGSTLARDALAALAVEAPHRAGNLLRWFLRLHGLRAPSAARLAAMLDQLVHAAPDARVLLLHEGIALGIHRGRIGVHAPTVDPFAVPWRGESTLVLPHGLLEFAPVRGEGLAAEAIARAPLSVRSRGGGERIRLRADGRGETLKRLLQEAGIPHWQRDDFPLVWCGDALAAVPGVAVAAAFRADAGAAGYDLRWRRSDVMR